MRNILLSIFILTGALLAAQVTTQPPVTWDETALREWATPIAGLDVRPGHFSAEEYHKAPVDNLRTYPVYYPGREPAGYWEMLQSVGPKPLIEPSTLTTEADWVKAGQRVFDEFDIAAFRVLDPQVVAFARRPQGFENSPVKPRPDGTLPDLRWIPTSKRRRAWSFELRVVPHPPDARWDASAGRAFQRNTFSNWTIQNGAVGRIGG